MYEVADRNDVNQEAMTGSLPAEETVADFVNGAHDRYLPVTEGTIPDYIPTLGRADPDTFGLSLTDAGGTTDSAGDTDVSFSIQSLSKPFVFALVCNAIGHGRVRRRVGVNNTGRPFNSVMALELSAGSPGNPMVNAGAMATTAMTPGETSAQQWELIREGLSRFAGRELHIDEEVYESETSTNKRNQAIARLLQSYGRILDDPVPVVDIYTRQCSLSVTVEDLAVMGATLSNGGVNPLTGDQVVTKGVCRDTLAVLASCGMYERSGEWMFEIGMPAKSGVSGGIVAVSPGKCGVAAYSPPLDQSGTSVRGQRVCSYLSRAMALNLFASVAGEVDYADPDDEEERGVDMEATVS